MFRQSVASQVFPGELYLLLVLLQWNIMFQGAIPAKILLDRNDVVQGYDYWGTELRTYAVTRFFNIILGKIDAKVFDFPSS